MDYFIGWCLVCEKSIPSDCLYCSENCQFNEFSHLSYLDDYTALRLNSTKIPLTCNDVDIFDCQNNSMTSYCDQNSLNSSTLHSSIHSNSTSMSSTASSTGTLSLNQVTYTFPTFVNKKKSNPFKKKV